MSEVVQLNVYVSPDLRKQLKIEAASVGMPLKAYLALILERRKEILK